MTARELAKSLHGKKSGHRWSCRCPTGLHKHGDRSRSLSVWESSDGWICLKCFAGCQRDEILSAMGLRVRDLALNGFTRNLEWEQRKKDQNRLALVERRNGLAIMMQAVETGKRRYWEAVERNSLAEIVTLRAKIYPDEAANIRRNQVAQHLITEYGEEYLWTLLPESLFTPLGNLSR